MYVYNIDDMINNGWGTRVFGEKPVPVPHSQQQNLHRPPWDRTQAHTVINWWLIATEMSKTVKRENKTRAFITRTQNILLLGTAPAHPGRGSLVKTWNVGK